MSPRQSLASTWHIADSYSALQIAGLLSLALDPADPVRKFIFYELRKQRGTFSSDVRKHPRTFARKTRSTW